MTLDLTLRARLLGAIAADKLVVLCGAGLSIPPPSSLPSAMVVANTCYDEWISNEALDPVLRDKIEDIAAIFHARGDFESVFIRRLVPWNNLVGTPNQGHAAIADFLISRAVYGVLSANFDPLIENWAAERKVAMRGALNGFEATDFQDTSNPLLKFHGCMQRGREQTIWTKAQLTEPAISERIRTNTEWMNLNLPGKHLVVVGFWSDWGYLNSILADAFTIRTAESVTVVSPGPTANLETKAPELWNKLRALSRQFLHVQASGDVFLNELRHAYSESWMKRFVAFGETQQSLSPPTTITLAAAPVAAHPLSPVSMEDLYDLRRDAEGIPYTRAATQKKPNISMGHASALRLRLKDAGASEEGAWLRIRGKSVRILNGAGRMIEEVQSSYAEPTSFPQADITICAGAISTHVPSRIISKGLGTSVVRSSAGAGSEWMTTVEAEVTFAI
jgi:hypothetical protein